MRPYKTFGQGSILESLKPPPIAADIPESAMGFWEIFRRKPPIRQPDELADLVDAQAAFLAQKGIYEYSRARAGHYSKVLFAEAAFQQAVEQSRWRAFPLALAMVAEIVEGQLRPPAGEDRQAVFNALVALVLDIFDRYPA